MMFSNNEESDLAYGRSPDGSTVRAAVMSGGGEDPASAGYAGGRRGIGAADYAGWPLLPERLPKQRLRRALADESDL